MTTRPQGGIWRLALFTALSFGLMTAGTRIEHLKQVQVSASIAVRPFQEIAAIPGVVTDWMKLFGQSRLELFEEKEQLRADNLMLQARLQRLESIERENERLTELLSASARVAQKALLAEIVQVDLDPFTRKILVNRGSDDGVYEGQPVIDPHGVIGQVTFVTPSRAAITLITDPDHVVPVQVRRNGLRAMVYGLGRSDQLNVPFVGSRANIEQGDILITSGMGGRFPAGYPVARVTEVVKDANEPFLGIRATPVARIDHVKEVLLVWHPTENGPSASQAEVGGDNAGADPTQPPRSGS